MLESSRWISIVAALAIAGAATSAAERVFIPEPGADRWMYSFNGTPGTRTTASTFSALPDPSSVTGVDDRFGQFIIRFDTAAAGIPAGLGAANYQIDSLTLRAVIAQNGGILHDPTPDPLSSFGPDATADPDPGRPIELHGTGFRGVFTAATFQENSAFGSSSPGSRNAYALGFDPEGAERDVSSNVTQAFESRPWATAVFEVLDEDDEWMDLAPGAVVPNYAVARFTIDLTDPAVSAYIRTGLDQGFLWFTISSLHSTSQQASEGFPAFFTKDHPEQAIFEDVAASLDITYSQEFRLSGYEINPVTKAVSLEWQGGPGFQYLVQRSSELTEESWETIQTFTPVVNETLIWSAPADSSPRRFFRIQRLPVP